MRPSKRPADAMREVSLTTGVNRHAEGSCLVKFGETCAWLASKSVSRLS